MMIKKFADAIIEDPIFACLLASCIGLFVIAVAGSLGNGKDIDARKSHYEPVTLLRGNTSVVKLQHEGHSYLEFHNGNTCIVHDPSCPCIQDK